MREVDGVKRVVHHCMVTRVAVVAMANGNDNGSINEGGGWRYKDTLHTGCRCGIDGNGNGDSNHDKERRALIETHPMAMAMHHK